MPFPYKHGMSRSREYRSWTAMKQRCCNPGASYYSDYGGRGIRVCDEWLDDFAAFYAYVGPCPEPGYSIHRIDNDGNYEPGNVGWASPLEQGRNSRKNRILEYDGRSQCMTAWAEEIGMDARTFRGRLYRGWSLERVMNTPARSKNI